MSARAASGTPYSGSSSPLTTCSSAIRATWIWSPPERWLKTAPKATGAPPAAARRPPFAWPRSTSATTSMSGWSAAGTRWTSAPTARWSARSSRGRRPWSPCRPRLCRGAASRIPSRRPCPWNPRLKRDFRFWRRKWLRRWSIWPASSARRRCPSSRFRPFPARLARVSRV